MFFGKKRKLGRKITEMNIGEKFELKEKIEDKDLLLYLGLTDDSNPLYIQHDYASQTPYKKPVVPTIMLTGIISSTISKYLPGPGSHIVKQELEFKKPIYHYGTVEFLFKIIDIHMDKHLVIIHVEGKNEKDEIAVEGILHVCPPYLPKALDENVLENF